MLNEIIQKLLNSSEPSIKYKTLANILEQPPDSPEIIKLQKQIKNSSRVETLLSHRDHNGQINCHPYRKWYGAHWVLAVLSDIGYPEGDKSLFVLRDQVYDWLFSKMHLDSIKTINGRVRRCASQEGYAIYYLLKLGIADKHTDELADRLIDFQWPDGGWNCDKNPAAGISSFIESLIPMRALFLHARLRNNPKSHQAAMKTSEIFLQRHLYKSLHDSKVMKGKFIKLHYPCYYEYDILFALKTFAENDMIGDNRCRDALNLLESKRLADGGFPSEAKLYRKITSGVISRGSMVNWDITSKKHYNEWVTADALYVIKKAGRLSPP